MYSAPNNKTNKENENGAEPSAPISKKGILTSFLTGKSMDIPDSDIVCIALCNNIRSVLIYFTFQLGRCRFVSEFEKLNRIGEGTYGIVCKYMKA
jgi:cyclin-dependent kinase 10